MSDPLFLDNDGKVRRGVRRVVNVNAPAAGTEWRALVPAGVMWRVLLGSALFTADATVGNRTVSVSIQREAETVFEAPLSGNYAAASVTRIDYVSGFSGFAAGANASRVLVPIPYVWYPQGTQIQSLTAFISAADAYTVVTLDIEEAYITNQQLGIRHEEREQERDTALEALAAATHTTPQQLLV